MCNVLHSLSIMPRTNFVEMEKSEEYRRLAPFRLQGVQKKFHAIPLPCRTSAKPKVPIREVIDLTDDD